MTEDNLKAKLAAALKVISEGDTEMGYSTVDTLLLKYPLQRNEILRERSQALSVADQFEEALNDRLRIINANEAVPADCYFAGEYALQAGQFEQARRMFDHAIVMSLRSGAAYYLQSSRLLIALACYQLNDDTACRNYLDLIDDEVEVLWLKGFNRVSKK